VSRSHGASHEHRQQHLGLQDHPTQARAADALQPHYPQGYGNRVASARVFAALGHASKADRRKAGATARPFADSANHPFPLGACG